MTLKFTNIASINKEIPQLVEQSSNKGYVQYGNDNGFPNYIWELYSNSALFSSIVTTMSDYIFGDGVESSNLPKFVNRKYETIEDIVKKLILDNILYGGFAFQIIRNKLNEIVEIIHIDFRNVRINENEDTVYYSDFTTKKRKNVISYPRYTIDCPYPNSIYYYKGNSKLHYPTPMYIGALKSIEITTQITDFHLNQILNSFAPSAIVNFNNGIISESEMEELEQKINEKFQGTQNSGRILLSFNNDTEHSTTIERLSDDGFDTKYQALAEQTKNDIYVGFRINPILLGYNTVSGFNKQEFSEAFTLYQKTVIQAFQKNIERVFNTIFGDNTLKFIPFKIDWGNEKESGYIPTQEETE